MQTVLIPRVSVFTTDTDIFTDLRKFSAITGYSPQPTLLALKPSATNRTKNKAKGLGNFFGKVRRAALSKTRREYAVFEDNESADTLFSVDLHNSWRHDKKVLCDLLIMHEGMLRAMIPAQEACWKSKAKMKKYQLILHAQHTSLEHNPKQRKARLTAIKDTERTLDKRTSRHNKDYDDYQRLQYKEVDYRQRIDRLAFTLQTDIEAKMKDAVTQMMKANLQQIFEREENNIVHQLYVKTCRPYEYIVPSLEPCLPEAITIPEYKDSQLRKKHFKNVSKRIEKSKKEKDGGCSWGGRDRRTVMKEEDWGRL